MSLITNLFADPNCYKQYGVHQATAARTSGKWSYTRTKGVPDNKAAITGVFSATLPVGLMLGIRTGTPINAINIQNAKLFGTLMQNAAVFQVTALGDHAIFLNTDAPVLLENIFVYTPQGYTMAKTLNLPTWPWFDGNTMPLK